MLVFLPKNSQNRYVYVFGDMELKDAVENGVLFAQIGQ
jgi:hypothetical protein